MLPGGNLVLYDNLKGAPLKAAHSNYARVEEHKLLPVVSGSLNSIQ